MKKNSNKGFSLVELIVVIAIMAIIAAVAIPVYSAYIESANKGVDEALAAEVKHVLELALIAKAPKDFAGGVAVIIGNKGASVEKLSAEEANDGVDTQAEDVDEDVVFITNALIDAYGSNWEKELKTKYSKWEAKNVTVISKEFMNSSFAGKQDELLGQIQTLSQGVTGILDKINNNEIRTGLLGGEYGNYITNLNIGENTTAQGNALTLYVAECTALKKDDNAKYGMTKEQQRYVASLYAGFVPSGDKDVYGTYNQVNQFADVVLASNNKQGFVNLAPALAASYAAAEGLCQYLDKNGAKVYDAEGNVRKETFVQLMNKEIDLTSIGDSIDHETAMLTLLLPLNDVIVGIMEDPNGKNLDLEKAYFSGDENSQVYKDMMGYFSALEAVVNQKESVVKKLGNNNCYTDKELLKEYNSSYTLPGLDVELGSIVIVVNCDPTEGGYSIISYPTDFE